MYNWWDDDRKEDLKINIDIWFANISVSDCVGPIPTTLFRRPGKTVKLGINLPNGRQTVGKVGRIPQFSCFLLKLAEASFYSGWNIYKTGECVYIEIQYGTMKVWLSLDSNVCWSKLLYNKINIGGLSQQKDSILVQAVRFTLESKPWSRFSMLYNLAYSRKNQKIKSRIFCNLEYEYEYHHSLTFFAISEGPWLLLPTVPWPLSLFWRCSCR